MTITMDFGEKTPAEGLSCMLLVEHAVSAKILPDGTVTTHMIAK